MQTGTSSHKCLKCLRRSDPSGVLLASANGTGDTPTELSALSSELVSLACESASEYTASVIALVQAMASQIGAVASELRQLGVENVSLRVAIRDLRECVVGSTDFPPLRLVDHAPPQDFADVLASGPSLPSVSAYQERPRRTLRPSSKLVSGHEGKPRKRLLKKKASSAKNSDASPKVAVLEVSKTNRSKPAVLEAITQTGDEKTKTAGANGANSSLPAVNASAREAVPSAAQAEVVRRPPSAEAQQLADPAAAAPDSDAGKPKESEAGEQGAKAGAAATSAGGNKTAAAAVTAAESSLATTCYGLFLRHGVLLLVLSVVCGISCLLGALLPVLFRRRRRGQVSQYPPPKRRFAPARILADPAVLRLFQRRDAMVA
ncbi:uncharacterized protein LOC144144530 isoform X2 [Haemaphysalis longicornis]